MAKYLCVLFTYLFLLSAVSGSAQDSVTLKSDILVSQNDPVKATGQWLNRIPENVRLRTNNYVEGNHWFLLFNFLCAGLVAILFLYGGLSAYLQRISNKVSKHAFKTLTYIGLYLVLSFIICLPLDIYQNYTREHEYGLSNQSFFQWLTDDLLSFLITLIFESLFLWFIYWLFRRTKTYWWAWCAGVSLIVLVVVLAVYPVFIAPLFNKYAPLKSGELKNELLSMTRANQVDIKEIYVYNESMQTKRYNASVSGFGGTTMISMNDNMLNQCTIPQIRAVVGHEIGHYVLNAIITLLVEFSLMIFVGFLLLKWSYDWLQMRFGKRWKLNGVTEITSLPLLFFLVTAYLFLMTPINNTIIRTQEREADMYGLNTSREPDGFASFVVKSSIYNKMSPSNLEEFFFYDHPSGENRILSAMKWKAENQRETTKSH